MVPSSFTRLIALAFALAFALAALLLPTTAAADETCMSPYMPKLIKGQEDYVYVWTLGVEGVGDGPDKLVTVDVNPASRTYGKVLSTASVGERGEAHHMGFTDDRRYLWAGGLDDSKIYVFDLVPDPSQPQLGEQHRPVCDRQWRRRRPAHVLRASRPHADPATCRTRRITPARPAWPSTTTTASSSLATRCAAGEGRVRLRRARPAAAQSHAQLVVHRLEQLHDGLWERCSATPRR